MFIKKLYIKNYKLFKERTIELNDNLNIFVGNNDSGKSTLLEIIAIITTGKLNGYSFDRQIKPSMFNAEVKNEYLNLIENGEYSSPPSIILEAYIDGLDAKYSGTNNECFENFAGIRLEVSISETNENIYKTMLENKDIVDIPVELYRVQSTYFSGENTAYRYLPINTLFVDTTRKDYSNLINHFVSNSFTDNLSDEQLNDIALAYKNSKNSFRDNKTIKDLNEILKEKEILDGKSYSISLKEETVDEWKNQMCILVDSIPFSNLGFGTQNFIKIGLAANDNLKEPDILLLEEPENNLSYSNMNILVSHILENNNKQVFISTHSSYIANKLNMNNLFLLNNGYVTSYSLLNEDTQRYFSKLPGYDTLRFILSKRVVLVEGSTDDLIIQRAYKDRVHNLPIEDGIDIISVGSLAMKRYLDLAKITNKEVIVVTDNDGDKALNIFKKYKDYIEDNNFYFYYENNDELNTIEPSVLNANSIDEIPSDIFKRVISKNNSLVSRDYNGVLEFMLNNKTEWAFRVFDSDENIEYPEYIIDVIKKLI